MSITDKIATNDTMLTTRYIKDELQLGRVFVSDNGVYQSEQDRLIDEFLRSRKKISKIETPLCVLMLALTGAAVVLGSAEDMEIIRNLGCMTLVGEGVFLTAEKILDKIKTEDLHQYITAVSAKKHGIGYYWDRKSLRTRAKEKFTGPVGDGYNDDVYVVDGKKLVNPSELQLSEAIVESYLNYVLDDNDRTDKSSAPSPEERRKYKEYIANLSPEKRDIYLCAINSLDLYYRSETDRLKTKKDEAKKLSTKKGKPIDTFWTDKEEDQLREMIKDKKALEYCDKKGYFDPIMYGNLQTVSSRGE